MNFLFDNATSTGHPTDFLGGVDLRTRAGFDAADVDDVGACGNRLVNRQQRGVGAVGRAAVKERVRRAIHDGHNDELVCGKLACS